MLLSFLLTAAAAHSGVHSSVSLHFSGNGPPTVQTSWGFIFPYESEWYWVCPEVLPQPSLYNIAIDRGGQWWIAALGGLYHTSDRCNFSRVAFEDMYLSQIEIDPQNRIWVSSASGYQENALWLSEDGGETFHATVDIGPDSRIYGFSRTGEHIWMIGDKDQEPYAWYQTPEGILQAVPLPVERWYSIVAIDPNTPQQLWLSAKGDEHSLYRLHIEDGLYEVLRAGASFNSLIQLETRMFLSTEAALFYSEDQGESWIQSTQKPETACLQYKEGYIYACTHSWEDGSSVMRAAPNGLPDQWHWESVMRFEDVHSIAQCDPQSDVESQCALLWDSALLNAGFTEEEKPTEEKQQESRGCKSTAQASFLFAFLLFARTRRQSQKDVTI